MAGTVRENALIGQVVANYRVGPLLGRGGMGAVYEVTHQYLGRRAALKVLHAQFARTPDLAARFVNEARAANLVQHPSVVSVFEIGLLPDDTPYILMEYLDGQPLSQRIRELAAAPSAASADGSRAAPPRAAARIVWSIQLVRQLASALRALHERGVIHRDLKPDNVVIVKDPEAAGKERAKLLDFGIAKIVGEFAAGESPFPGVPAQVKTALGALLGTPIYMGPEQWRGKGNVDHRTDIYALGCIFYEMLTGRPPYCASAIAQLMQMHVWQKPPSALFVQTDVPRQLAELVQKMLAKEPAERPSTDQLDRELEQLLVRLQTPPPAAPAAHQAATFVMRSVTTPSEDDTIPAGRLSPQELFGAAVPAPLLLAPSRNQPPLPTTEPAPPSQSLSDFKLGGIGTPSGDAMPVPPMARTSSGSAQMISLPKPAWYVDPSRVMAGLALLIVIAVGVVLALVLPDPPPPPPTPAAPPAADVALVIRSTPPGADIYESKTHRFIGKTPFLYQDSKYQQMRIILSRPGFQDRHVTADWENLLPIDVKLRPIRRRK